MTAFLKKVNIMKSFKFFTLMIVMLLAMSFYLDFKVQAEEEVIKEELVEEKEEIEEEHLEENQEITEEVEEILNEETTEATNEIVEEGITEEVFEEENVEDALADEEEIEEVVEEDIQEESYEEIISVEEKIKEDIIADEQLIEEENNEEIVEEITIEDFSKEVSEEIKEDITADEQLIEEENNEEILEKITIEDFPEEKSEEIKEEEVVEVVEEKQETIVEKKNEIKKENETLEETKEETTTEKEVEIKENPKETTAPQIKTEEDVSEEVEVEEDTEIEEEIIIEDIVVEEEIVTMAAKNVSTTKKSTVKKSVSLNVDGFVTRLYQNILNRDPDKAGLNYWVKGLKSGKITGSEALTGFFTSNEIKNKNLSNKAFIEELYNTVLNRKSDEGGLQYWKNRLDVQMSREYVINGFASSNEFFSMCKKYNVKKGDINKTKNYRDENYEVTAFVDRMYNQTLYRKAEIGGLEYWCNELVSGKGSGASLASGFFLSEEFGSKKLSAEQKVTTAYNVMLDRKPDKNGLKHWSNYLNKGLTLNFVINGFVGSQEFANICKTYGINTGTVNLTTVRDANPEIAVYVHDLYYEAQGKKPSAAEVEDAIQKLVSKNASLKTLAKSYYLNGAKQSSNEEYVKSLYKGLFQKNPSKSDVKEYTKQLKSGVSRTDIFNEIANRDDLYNKSRELGVISGGTSLGRAIVAEAKKWIDKGIYVMGGVNPATGADCSGFIVYVCNKIGLSLPRTAYEIGKFGVPIDERDAKEGDLIMWTGHASIYSGNNLSIHCIHPKVIEIQNGRIIGAGSYVGYIRLPHTND